MERSAQSRGCKSQSTNTGLSGRKLLVVRAIWLVMVVPALVLFVAGLPVYYGQIQKACVDAITCNLVGALSREGLRQLPALGLSASSYAALLVVFFIIIVGVWSGIGLLIFWRRSDDGFALFSSFFLIIFNTTYPGFTTTALALVSPILGVPLTFLGALGVGSVITFLILFPNGRLVPRWMGIVLVLGVLFAIVPVIMPPLPPASPFNSNTWPGWFTWLLNVPLYVAIIFSQIYRYLRASSPVERQQIKWVVFGIVFVMMGFIVLSFLLHFIPSYESEPNIPSSVFLGLINYPVVLLALPVTIGIAILRSRLYNIDVIINRTLVYGSLTALLALVYFGLVFGLQAVFEGLFHQSNAITVVVSTLAIATLFTPLRHRMQTIIDYRFYRRKYDAVRTIEEFSVVLRSEIHLTQLSDHLVTVVRETMQPSHVTLWLRERSQERDGERASEEQFGSGCVEAKGVTLEQEIESLRNGTSGIRRQDDQNDPDDISREGQIF